MTSTKPGQVTVNVVPAGTFIAPNLRASAPGTPLPDNSVWNVAANSTLSIPVTNDWRNYGTGDPVALNALAAGAVQRGHAITTSDGTIEYQAPNTAGADTISYVMSDGTAQTSVQKLTINVLAATNHGTPPVANDDYTRGTVGVAFTFNPLLNDLPGADPQTQDAKLALQDSVKSTNPGLTVVDQASDGTLTLLGSAAGPYTLSYVDSYGAMLSTAATIRVDIDPVKADALVETGPDSVTVFGSQPGLVDVLSNDLDPAGQLLTVVGVTTPAHGNLTAAVVQGRWIRVNATQSPTAAKVETLTYQVADGIGGRTATGQVTVNELVALTSSTPLVENDYATVRQGDEVSVPVLDNDSTQDGSPLTLEQDYAGDPAGPKIASGQLPVAFVGSLTGDPGSAFISGNKVRFTAPVKPTVKTAQQVVITYQVLGVDGTTQNGSVFVTITPPGTKQNDRAPVAQDVQARVVSGGSTVIAIPTTGVDPDGDTVQVVGLAANADGTVGPKLGEITATTANSLSYRAFPSVDIGGTDTFRYSVVDTYGVTATATVQVSVVQPTVLPDPVPHPISIYAAPGTTIQVKVITPAHIDYPEGVPPTLADPQSTNAGVDAKVTLAPDDPDSIQIVIPPTAKNAINLGYQVVGESGIRAASGITVHVVTGYIAPPIAVDQFAQFAGNPSEVQVPLLVGDVSQSSGTLRVVSPTAGLNGSTLTVATKDFPQVIPYVIADSNGGQATAVVYVPAGGASAVPYWNGSTITIPTPGSPFSVDITKYVKSPSGQSLDLTTKSAAWAAPGSLLTPEVKDNTHITLTSQKDGSGNLYQGPASVTFPVRTTADLNSVTYITVPVIIGQPSPVLRCPSDQIPVTQGFDSNPIDISTECHVWTVSGDTSQLTYDLTVLKAVAGVSVAKTGVAKPSVRATSDALVDGAGTLTVGIHGVNGPTSQIGVVVHAAPDLQIASIPVQTVTSGAATTINLQNYFVSPFQIDAVHFVGAPTTTSTIAVGTSRAMGDHGQSQDPGRSHRHRDVRRRRQQGPLARPDRDHPRPGPGRAEPAGQCDPPTGVQRPDREARLGGLAAPRARTRSPTTSNTAPTRARHGHRRSRSARPPRWTSRCRRTA